MQDLLKDKTAGFQSGEYKVDGRPFMQAYVQVSGTGTVEIETKGQDGTWRSFPETRMVGPIAQVVALPMGSFRIKVTLGTATIEVFW